MSSNSDIVIYLLNITSSLSKIFGSFIIIIGTIGNLLNCFIFSRISPLNKHPNALFIIGSSIGSFFFINLGLLPAVLQIYTGINLLNRSLFWCKTNIWLYYSAGCFSYMCNCYTAFGQYLITLPKMKWQRLITHLIAQLIILLTAVFWLFIYLPLPIYFNHIQTSSTTYVCRMSNTKISIYATYWLVIGYYLLPIILIFILFCLTLYNLKQLLRRRRSLEGAVTRMMLIQMSVILASGIPASISTIYTLITQYYSKTLLRLAYENLIMNTINLFTFLTNGLSFWVYLFVSKTFRKHLKDYFMKSRLFRHRIRPFSITTSTRINLNH